MDISISHQVSATYARNNFKAVNEQALRDGICVIVKKSKPITVVLPISEYQKLTQPAAEKPRKKMTLAELQNDNYFDDCVGGLKDAYPPEMSSVEIAKKWTDYVD